jgi:orotate phosphoribosyltransferase
MSDIHVLRNRLKSIVLTRSFRYSPDPPFLLTSGKTSPYYFDCKKTTLEPEGAFLIGEILWDMVRDMPPVGVGGLTLGADPMASALMHSAWRRGRRIPQFIVRKEPKKHGTAQWIEGNVQPGDRVLIVDDVVTTGGSVIKSIERAKEAGLIVQEVILLVDREEFNAMEHVRIAADSAPVRAILTKTELMELYNSKESA